MKAEIYKDEKGLWRWRIKARNGKVVGASSEAYVRRAACERNLWAITAMREKS